MGIVRESNPIGGDTVKLLKLDVNSFLVTYRDRKEKATMKSSANELYEKMCDQEHSAYLDHMMCKEVEADNRKREFYE